MLGHQIKSEGPDKPLDRGQAHYLGGDNFYPTHLYSHIYFYDDRFERRQHKLKIYYSSIKNIENTTERKFLLINRVICNRENKGKKANLVL